MRSIAGHVAVALENALGISSVEAYQHDLTRERDRLSFQLEINNHVVTILDINDLFWAASASIRKHFANDFASFMLFDGRSDRLNIVVLDFPASRGFMSDIPLHVAREDLERLRARQPKPLTASDKMPPLRQSVLEFHLTSHSNIEPSLPAHFLEYRRSEHGMSLARGGADRLPRPRPKRESILSSETEGMLEQAACDELLGRLHHVLPHLERSPLLIEKCESLFSAHGTALFVPQTHEMRKCDFGDHSFIALTPTGLLLFRASLNPPLEPSFH
jgi:hypothetical protein